MPSPRDTVPVRLFALVDLTILKEQIRPPEPGPESISGFNRYAGSIWMPAASWATAALGRRNKEQVMVRAQR